MLPEMVDYVISSFFYLLYGKKKNICGIDNHDNSFLLLHKIPKRINLANHKGG